MVATRCAAPRPAARARHRRRGWPRAHVTHTWPRFSNVPAASRFWQGKHFNPRPPQMMRGWAALMYNERAKCLAATRLLTPSRRARARMRRWYEEREHQRMRDRREQAAS